jgi:hypothetical protein
MGEAQGKKVDPSAVAAQAIEALAVLWPDQAIRGRVIRPVRQHWGEDVAKIDNLHKRLATSGEGRETLAYEWAATTRPDHGHTTPASWTGSARDAVSVSSKR